MMLFTFIFLIGNSVPDFSSETRYDTSELKLPLNNDVNNRKSAKTSDEFDLNEAELQEREQNNLSVKKLTTQLSQSCDDMSNVDETVTLVSNFFKVGLGKKMSARGVNRCKNVFMDLGANIGDSVGKFLEADLLGCQKNGKGVRYNVETREFYSGSFNRISTSFNEVMMDNKKRPSDFCIYGVEGNPHHTPQLRSVEGHIMSMSPRPVNNLHFLTEHVATKEDGPTKLFLDTVNEKQNFWGSSILESHQDVLKSANEGGTGTVSFAPVTGITLSTLMKRTLLAYSPIATPDEKSGGHLIVKVDIEGGEYALLEEASKSLLLCDFLNMGNTVDLIIEFHRMSIKDGSIRGPLLAGKAASIKKLEECGVKVKPLSASWH